MVELSNCLWVPVADFTPEMREDFTVKVYSLDGTEQIVEAFRTDRAGYVGLPRCQGLKLFSNVRCVDKLAHGRLVKFRREIKLLDYQVPFVQSMMDAAESRTDFIAKAATGKGKTVCALAVIQKIKQQAVVIVDQENLMDQWIERCIQHLGMKESEIGIVQKDRRDEGKAITIAMVQTLSRRSYDPEFYRQFGIAIFDESHTAGAPTFSRALMKFSARVRFGLSATPKRDDALDKVIKWNLGTIGAVLEDAPGRSNVYIRESQATYSWRNNNSRMVGGFVNEIAADARRNLLIVESLKWLYETGRDVMVIGDRVEHLCSLMALAEASGLPSRDMGLYSKTRTVYRYEKDPKPARQPEWLVKKAEYSPVRLALVQKTIPKPQRVAVLKNARVIFATYGVIAKGLDVPRLSAGIDATSRSEATQVLGRTLRVMPGKLKPIWVTIADVNSFRSLYQLQQRLPDYESSNAEVFLWEPSKGRKRLDIRAYRKELASRISLLRRSRIITKLDGSYTLVIPDTPNASAS